VGTNCAGLLSRAVRSRYRRRRQIARGRGFAVGASAGQGLRLMDRSEYDLFVGIRERTIPVVGCRVCGRDLR
jgi:hypothetical protein